MQQETLDSWCWSALFYDGHPSASFQKLCVPTCSTDRFTTPASILAWLDGGDSPDMATTQAPGGRAARHRGDVSSCAICTSPVGDLTHCLTCCPAFADLRIQWCAAAHVAPAEASLWDAALLIFQSAGFGQHPLHCARTYPVCWSGVLPASILADGDVLSYDASSGKRSSKLLFRVNAPLAFSLCFSFLFI